MGHPVNQLWYVLRIVNVCSQAGLMSSSGYADALIDVFRRPDYTEADIDRFVEDYKRFAHENTRREHGYPESAYRVSKAAEIAYSLLLARQLKSRNIFVNAVSEYPNLNFHKSFLVLSWLCGHRYE